MTEDGQDVGIEGLLAFIDACPTPFHVVDRAAAALTAAGFTPMDEAAEWPDASGRRFVCRDGSLVAWRHHTCEAGFRIIGAHTDSPNLRITPQPDTGQAGYRQLGVEVYGGALVNSWLDRDLGVAGRLATPSGTRLFRIDQPVLRVPQLAIHLDREVNQKGLLLNPQTHLAPVWGLGLRTPGEFAAVVAEAAGLAFDDVLAWDAMLHDLTASTVAGLDGEFIFAPRIDNQVSCWAGLQALLDAPADAVPSAVLCLFDHEAAFAAACEKAGVGHQIYAHRNDMPCGSTIGPFAAATTGVTTVDAGVAQLSMHSAREMCGSQDPLDFALALGAFLSAAA